MAAFDVTFSDNLMSALLDTDCEKICRKALKEAAPILVDSLKKSARAAVLHEGESEMVNSIAFSEVKRTKDGSAYITTVGPRGYSKHIYDPDSIYESRIYVSNALKAVWKEYGIAGKQAPRPFIAHATGKAEVAVMRKLQEIYDDETGGRE
ncbi:MAG: HK97 gp10 family phage protein [Lachnospiraceae bacterium]